MATQLSIRNLKKTYDRRNFVLTDVNVEAEKGEFIVLVGPSGCGKSTLLRMIAGLEDISDGEIHIAGRRVNDVPPARRDIAMVFQDYALYPHMSVRQNLEFALKIQKASRSEMDRRVKFASDMLGIDPLLERKPSQLSGGQRQRVAIGRAIVREPSIFLFDEPLSNLDAQLRAQTRIELASLHRELGSTSVYVTHDQVEAMTLADKIVVLNKGRVQQVGSPLELYNRPANKFVASFIGNPSMNFIDGRLAGGAFEFDGHRLDVGRAPVEGDATLGIRPEGLVLASGGSGDLRARVILVEGHGYESQLVAELDGRQVIARASEPGTQERMKAMKRGENVTLNLDRHALHWFSSDPNGKRLD